VRIRERLFFLVPLLFCAVIATAEETRTSLIIEGGGLPPYCPSLERLVEAATVKGRIRIGYLPAASSHPEASSEQFIERMKPYGVRPEQIDIIAITLDNRSTEAESPAVVRRIRECTSIFFGGGDQTRITRALRRPDGKSTAVLEAIYAVWKEGAVVAGTSAGAAVQSETMMTVSGVPDDTIDEGLDALDFGLTKSIDEPARRGLLISRGLGFLQSGIIDQHFSQYRGRLGRLARATTEQGVRYGFGIDEDAGLAVAVDGTFEVLGPGQVTIVDSANATCHDGPLGCRISGIHLTCLASGDRFDPKTGKSIIHHSKKLVERGRESSNGNFLIPDIAGRGAVTLALFGGLGNNTSHEQIGIALKYNGHYGHGFQYTFSKLEKTKCYSGTLSGVDVDAVTDIRLEIEPITMSLRRPETGLPSDLPDGPSRTRLEAISFRGIMTADDKGRFRPREPITRGELAIAIAQTIRLEPPRSKPPVMNDLGAMPNAAKSMILVAGAELMKFSEGLFKPTEFISRQEAAAVLVRLAERYRSQVLKAEPFSFKDVGAISADFRDDVRKAFHEKLLSMDDRKIRPLDKLSREEAAEALFTLIDFPWSRRP